MQFISPTYTILSPDFSKCPDAEKDLCKMIELAARTCYKSTDKIMEGSAEKICKNLIARGHEAMLEHASITVLFTVDRGITHEAVRHRMASFAQESSRYCNYSKEKFGSNIRYIDLRPALEIDPVTSKLGKIPKDAIIQEWMDACRDAEFHYLRMIELGCTPQIARAALNNSTASELVVTANIREWRHILSLRAVGTTGKPHPQMEEIMVPLLRDLATHLPSLFADTYVAYMKAHHENQKGKNE